MTVVPHEAPPKVRWYNSLILRVIVLCIVLVVCLMNMVFILTTHFFRQVVEEFDAQATEMVQTAQVWVTENPEVDFEQVESNLRQLYPGTEMEIDTSEITKGAESTVPTLQNGQLEFRAAKQLVIDGKPVTLLARFRPSVRTQILRAFRNQYLLGLTLAFLITLGLMIHFIVSSLRPLRELSETCAEISEGKWRPVQIHHGAGEVHALEATFNRMVHSLQEKEVMESNLRRAQRLSSLGTLAAGVAHDVRNPLNAIKLLSSHAIDSVESDPGVAALQLQTIRREVDRLDEIVTGFLSLAKERELQVEPTRIDALLEECARLVKEDARARKVEIVTDLSAGDTELMIDPKQTKRALLNVVINALEASQEGGRVRLVSRVDQRECVIEVIDEGSGLSQEAAERAFDPYYTTKSTGTGLGLAITRGIVEEHGGVIELTAAENTGTRALITLPRA